MPRPTSQDLAGYWDMLQLSVEDVSMKFDELHQLKLKDWKIIESPERKVTLPGPRAPHVLLPAGPRSLTLTRQVLLCVMPHGLQSATHDQVCRCLHAEPAIS